MQNVILEKTGGLGVITISRPEVLNALNYNALKELDNTADRIREDGEIRCVIITGSGDRAFVAGADINELKDMDVNTAHEFSVFGGAVFRKIELLEKPVIAAVNGYALGGGCELALCCDIRFASENAVFGQPEVLLGVMPGFGGTQRLARTVGSGMAGEMLFSGRQVKADEALRIGLVNRVVKKEELMNEVRILADRIARNAPLAVKGCKMAVGRGMQCDIDTALAYETEVFSRCFASGEQKAAMNAFLEKRQNG